MIIVRAYVCSRDILWNLVKLYDFEVLSWSFVWETHLKNSLAEAEFIRICKHSLAFNWVSAFFFHGTPKVCPNLLSNLETLFLNRTGALRWHITPLFYFHGEYFFSPSGWDKLTIYWKLFLRARRNQQLYLPLFHIHGLHNLGGSCVMVWATGRYSI